MTEYKQIMFYVGAQADNDGEMLPETFTVFSPIVDQDEAIQTIMVKIMEDLSSLNLERAAGAIAFREIATWQDFSELKIHDCIKMEALAAAVTQQFLTSLLSYGDLRPVISAFWVPPKDD